jgi:hypothetical protein
VTSSLHDKKSARFCPDPIGRVELYTGRPLWIATLKGARWQKCQTSVHLEDRIVVGADRSAPFLFPELAPQPSTPHHGYGRPRRIDTNSELVLFVAWARDVAGMSEPKICALLYAEDAETHHVDEKERKRVERATRDGRRLYHERGVLPWAAYPDGRPPSQWWEDHRFHDAIRDWQFEAMRRVERGEPFEPQPDPERAEREQIEKHVRSFKKFAAPALASVREALKPDLSELHKRISVSLGLPKLFPQREPIDRDTYLREHGVEPWTFGHASRSSAQTPTNRP